MDTRSFFFLVPLSNWILGYDRYSCTWDKSRLPSNRFPHDTYVLTQEDKKGLTYALEKTQALIEKLGIPGDRVVRIEVDLPVDGQPCAEPNTTTGTGIGWRWPSAVVKVKSQAMFDGNNFVPMFAEGITAKAFALRQANLKGWDECHVRSFSVLPIAQACNARCAFCFSKASVSNSILPSKLDVPTIAYWAGRAQKNGAKRAVITGGGEATLLKHNLLIELIEILNEYFPYTLMIGNGSIVEKWAEKHGDYFAVEKIRGWSIAGLSRLAISRHGTDLDNDAAIMGLAVNTPRIMKLVKQAGIPIRLICVMQKGGVDSPGAIQKFLERAVIDGADQVCFKELYVSSLSENPWARSKENIYCQENQVGLDVLISTLRELGFSQSMTLPWGSPCFDGHVLGKRLRVAAYTEPSVGWERSNGVVRSWNLMSDGNCLASLEDPASLLEVVK